MAILGAIIAVCFLLGGVYAVVRPQYALLFILFLFPVKQLLQVSVPYFQSDSGGQQVNIAAGIVVLASIASLLLRKQDILRGFWNGVAVVVLLIYLQIMVGLAYTPSRGAALFLLNQWWPYAVLLLLLQPMLLSRLDDLRRIIPAFLFVGSLVAVMVFVLGTNVSGRWVLTIGRDFTGKPVLGNPLATAELGGMLVICAAFYRTSTPSFLMTLLRLVGIVLGLTLALLTGSRGQLLGAVLVFALFIPVAYKVRSIGGFLAMVVGIAFFGIMLIGVAQAFSGAEVASRWTEKNLAEGAGGRLSFAWQLVQAYLQNPAYWFSGLGPGAFNAVVPNPDGGFHYPHNVLVEALGENGLLGLGMFITAVALCFVWGRKLLALVEDVPELRGALAILAGMTAFAVFLAVKQSSLLGTPTYFAWMIMLAKVAKAELSLATMESAHYDYDQPTEGYETDEHGEPLPAG